MWKGKGVIYFFSIFCWYWDILLIMFIFMYVIFLFVSIVFLSDDFLLYWFIFNGIFDCIFFIDIFLNFKIGFIDFNNNDEVILDKKIICWKYVCSWFVIDLVLLFFFDYVYFIVLFLFI